MVSSTTRSFEEAKKLRPKGRLKLKLMICCVLLAALITGSCCMVGYMKYKQSTFRIYNEFAYQIANVASSYVDGNKIEEYQTTGNKDAEYEEMSRNLYELYSNTGVASIYICVPDPEELTIFNIFDARFHEVAEEHKPYYDLGAVDPIGAENPQLIVDVFLTGNFVDDYFIRETEYGYNTSAVVPVMNDAGVPAALLVVDVPMSLINHALQEYLVFSVCGSAIVAVIFLFFFLVYLRKGIIAPLRLIAQEAASFVENEANISEKLLSVYTRDEIEYLAKSIHQMEVDTRQYIETLTSVTAEKERISAELNVATQIQASMLPCIFPAFPDRNEIDIYATMDPAKEVGGDFYDFFMVDDRHLAIVMADVSGKGVPAALFMVIGKTLIKDHTTPGTDLGKVFSEVNNMLCASNSEGLFITAFEGVLDLVTGEFNFVNAGHEMPFICKAGGDFEPHKIRAGFVLAGMEDIKYRAGSMMLEPGDKIFQYTDGVTEATNLNNELYGMERLSVILNKVKTGTPDEILPAVKKDIDKFVGEADQFDDITMLCLEYRARMEIKEGEEA